MTLRSYIRRWWVNDPTVVACDLCGCPIQATQGGRVMDGMRAHYKTVHPGAELVVTPTEAAR